MPKFLSIVLVTFFIVSTAMAENSILGGWSGKIFYHDTGGWNLDKCSADVTTSRSGNVFEFHKITYGDQCRTDLDHIHATLEVHGNDLYFEGDKVGTIGEHKMEIYGLPYKRYYEQLSYSATLEVIGEGIVSLRDKLVWKFNSYYLTGGDLKRN